MYQTVYCTEYFAPALTKRYDSDGDEKLARTGVDVQGILNRHQIKATLFAFASPLSKVAEIQKLPIGHRRATLDSWNKL